MANKSTCPRCLKKKDMKFPALSRRDNKTDICSDCGVEEAMFDMFLQAYPDDTNPAFVEVKFLMKLLKAKAKK